MHLSGTGKEKKIMGNYPSHGKTACLLVKSTECNPGAIVWLQEPNCIPQKQDIFGFSEITNVSKKTYGDHQLEYDSMPLQKRKKDSHYLPSRIGIPLSFYPPKDLTQHLLDIQLSVTWYTILSNVHYQIN